MANVLTVQDISCVGRCSLTVALPIISACGVETSVLPTAVLSTHTGISGGTFRDLTADLMPIGDHWEKAGVKFDYIYTGYLGSIRQMDAVRQVMEQTAGEHCLRVIDPAMADNGKLYSGFDGAFVAAMKEFCAHGDILLPNLTESCLLTDTPYPETYDREFIETLMKKLLTLGCGTVVLTGVSFAPGTTGVMVMGKDLCSYYRQEKLPRSYHGTGDIYASAFVGALARGVELTKAAALAADFCADCIRATDGAEEKWRGVRFEPLLETLGSRIRGA